MFVVVSELILAGHRSSHLKHSETADAEGMLLLKDPSAMLSALEKCVRFNNFVPGAGPGYTLLFYCYTGDSTDDETDPEMRRVARLREVLGVEGAALPKATPNVAVPAPPVAPRLAGTGRREVLPEWSVLSEGVPRASMWKSIVTVGVLLLGIGAMAWAGMLFDASLPRAYAGGYDAVPLGHVFYFTYRLFVLLCIAAPLTVGLLDRRVSVGIGVGVVSAVVWALLGIPVLAGPAGDPTALAFGIAFTAAISGVVGVALGRVVGMTITRGHSG